MLIWCTNESAYKYWWLDSTASAPTVCPTNTLHTVNTPLIVDTISPNVVNINQEAVPTGEHYRFDTKAFTATANTTTLYSFSFPIPVSLFEGSFVSSVDNRGDTWSWIVSENTTVGALTATANENDTVLSVSSTVVQYVEKGFEVRLVSGGTSQNLGLVLAVDELNNTITVQTACTQTFNAGTYVQMSIVFMRDCEFGHPWVYEYGSSKIKSSYIPANTIIKVYYTNNSPDTDKRIVVNMEYLY